MLIEVSARSVVMVELVVLPAAALPSRRERQRQQAKRMAGTTSNSSKSEGEEDEASCGAGFEAVLETTTTDAAVLEIGRGEHERVLGSITVHCSSTAHGSCVQGLTANPH